MREFTLAIPGFLDVAVSRDYAKYCSGDPVYEIQENAPNRLIVRWDEEILQIVGPVVGTGYRTSAIGRIELAWAEPLILKQA